jgi:hypothetical protein
MSLSDENSASIIGQRLEAHQADVTQAELDAAAAAQADVDAEQARATAAEQAVQTAATNEAARAQTAESAEATRAQAAEAANTTSIANHASSSTAHASENVSFNDSGLIVVKGANIKAALAAVDAAIVGHTSRLDGIDTILATLAGREIGGAQQNAAVSITAANASPSDITGMNWTATIGSKPVMLILAMEMQFGQGSLAVGAFNTQTVYVIDTTGGASVEIARIEPRMIVQQTVSLTRAFRLATMTAGLRSFKLTGSIASTTGAMNLNPSSRAGGLTAVMVER